MVSLPESVPAYNRSVFAGRGMCVTTGVVVEPIPVASIPLARRCPGLAQLRLRPSPHFLLKGDGHKKREAMINDFP